MMEAWRKLLTGEGCTVDGDDGLDCCIIGVSKVDIAVLGTVELLRLASSPM